MPRYADASELGEHCTKVKLVVEWGTLLAKIAYAKGWGRRKACPAVDAYSKVVAYFQIIDSCVSADIHLDTQRRLGEVDLINTQKE